MTFLEAVAAIANREDVWLCADQDELSGRHFSICVYAEQAPGYFVGKLRWPRDGQPARVDEEVEAFLAALPV